MLVEKIPLLATGAARGAGLSLLISVSAIGLGVLTQALLARVLQPAGFGVYSYCIGWLNLGVLLAKFDLDTIAVRFAARLQADGKFDALRAMSMHLLRMSSMLSLGIGATFFLFGFFALRLGAESQLAKTLQVTAAMIPFLVLLTISSGILQATGRIAAAQAPMSILRPLVFLTVLASSSQLGARATPVLAMLSNGAGVIVALWASGLLLSRSLKGFSSAHISREDAVSWWSTARGLLLVSLGQFVLSTQIDVVLVGLVATKTDAGYYASASQISSLSLLGVAALQATLTPRIGMLHAAGDTDGLQRLVDRERRTSWIVNGVPSAVILLFGPWLLLIYGSQFAVHAYPFLAILVLMNVIPPIFGNLGGYLLTLTGNQLVAARIMLTTSLAYAALALVLGSLLGARGIAAATVLAYLMRARLIDVAVLRLVGVHIRGRPQRDRILSVEGRP